MKFRELYEMGEIQCRELLAAASTRNEKGNSYSD